MKIRDYTEKLSFYEKMEIISDYEQFERDGSIGDCLLRRTARKIMNDIGINNSIVIWMINVVNDVYRIIAERALEQGYTD